MFRHSALDQVGYFDESLKRHQEIQLFAFFTYKFRLKLIDCFLTCIDQSDISNKPDISQLTIIKNDLFKSVKPLLKNLPQSRQNRIFIMHDFEIANALYQHGCLKEAIQKGKSIFKSPITIYFAIEKSFLRINSRIMKNLLLMRR